MKRLIASIGFVALLSLAGLAQTPVFTINDLLSLKRVNDPQISPDGRTVAFSVGTVDKSANKTLTQIWIMNVDGSKQHQIDFEPVDMRAGLGRLIPSSLVAPNLAKGPIASRETAQILSQGIRKTQECPLQDEFAPDRREV